MVSSPLRTNHSFWLGLCGGFLTAVLGFCTYAFLQETIPSENKKFQHRVSSAQIIEKSTASTARHKIPRLAEENTFLPVEDTLTIMQNPNLYTLDVLATAVDSALQRGQDFVKLLDLVGSIENEDFRRLLQHVILNQVTTTMDGEDLFATLSKERSGTERDQLLRDVTTRIADQTPITAIELVERHVDNRLKDILFEDIIRTWADSNPEELYSNLDQFPSEWARRYGLLHASLNLATISPENAINLISRFKGTLVEELLVEQLARDIAIDNPESAIAWADSTPNVSPELRPLLLAEILSRLAISDPKFAYAHALASNTSAGKVLRIIAQSNLDLAQELYRNYQVGDKHVPLAAVLGDVMVEQKQYQEAISFGDQIPPPWQQNYFDSMFNKWACFSPNSLMNAIREMPTSTQLPAAMQLLNTHHTIPVLNDEEVEYLWTLFPEESDQRTELLDFLDLSNDWRLSLFLPSGKLMMISKHELSSAYLRRFRLRDNQ